MANGFLGSNHNEGTRNRIPGVATGAMRLTPKPPEFPAEQASPGGSRVTTVTVKPSRCR